MNSDLIMFLYLLAREHLPTGVIERLIEDVEMTCGKNVTFSSPQLAALAMDWKKRLVQRENLASSSSSSKSSAASSSRTH